MLAIQNSSSAYFDAQAAVDDDDFDDLHRDRTCRACDGDGGDKWSDGIMPCSVCQGEGREW